MCGRKVEQNDFNTHFVRVQAQKFALDKVFESEDGTHKIFVS
jgi:hypothetical protein